MRNPAIVVLAVVMSLCLLGCQKRSISDSGYRSNHGYYHGGHSYSQELSEYDVLGVDRKTLYSEADIAQAFNDTPITDWLRKGDRVLLVQSGAQIPDAQMCESMEKYFNVQAFNGIADTPDHQTRDTRSNPDYIRLLELLIEAGKDVPDNLKQDKPQPRPSYATSLRMAAAKAGINTI
ncbi:MAG: hypothetical protein ACF8OB_02105, partial [Phycisphaeraceae bacterium JB051]